VSCDNSVIAVFAVRLDKSRANISREDNFELEDPYCTL
jgi:hypothetical protein